MLVHITLSSPLNCPLDFSLKRHWQHFCMRDPMNALFLYNFRAVMLVHCNEELKDSLRKSGPVQSWTHYTSVLWVTWSTYHQESTYWATKETRLVAGKNDAVPVDRARWHCGLNSVCFHESVCVWGPVAWKLNSFGADYQGWQGSMWHTPTRAVTDHLLLNGATGQTTDARTQICSSQIYIFSIFTLETEK